MSMSMFVPCGGCGLRTEFQQDYAYHAGFGNTGFLYNDTGNLTLTWSSYDPAYTEIVGQRHPWTLTEKQQQTLENRLKPAPSGGLWRFKNPARCKFCGESIMAPMKKSIY
jgi:hypothetical protein